MDTIYIIIIPIVIVIINLIIIFLYFNGYFNTIKPSDLNLFKDFSSKINPSLLEESTQIYNEAVSKYFEILNKYALIDNKNINAILY